MVKRLNVPLLLLFSISAFITQAQELHPPTVNIGDPAPALQVKAWLKGDPIPQFQKGKIYVVEFWATWCIPCKAAIPHLSDLAREYKDKVTFIGIDVYDEKTSMERLKAFVDSMGSRMDYHVAADDRNAMVTGWLEATGEQPGHGIPRSFVVNADGQLAWIGYPKKLENILPKIVNRDWDIQEALAKRKADRYLQELDDSLSYEFAVFKGKSETPDDLGKPDAALVYVDKIISDEPKLKYAPRVAFQTFTALLKTNPHKAYEYGKVLLVTDTYEDFRPSDCVIYPIKWYADVLNLPAEIYQLGAEAYQVEIDEMPYPEIADMPRRYNNMAEWYWRAHVQSKAIDAQQKAIETLKSRKGFAAKDLEAFEYRLELYKKM